MRRWLLAATALIACGSPGRVVPGSGVQVTRSVVQVDPARVPILPDCGPGRGIQRQGGRFVCGLVRTDGLRPGVLAERTTEVAAIEVELSGLDRRIAAATATLTALAPVVAALRAELDRQRGASATHPLAIPAIACPRNAISTTHGEFTDHDGLVWARLGGPVDAHIYCPIFSADPAPAWNAYELLGDVVSAAPGGSVVDFRNAIYTKASRDDLRGFGDVSASYFAFSGFGAARANLQLELFDRQGGIDARLAGGYAHSDDAVYLKDGNAAPASGFAGIRLLTRTAARPRELEGVGGTLRLDTGRVGRTVDGDGHAWEWDLPYLAPGHLPVEYEPALGNDAPAVDRSGIGDRVPALVFERDRRHRSALDYQLAVPDGRYAVSLYFAETCEDCTVVDGGMIDFSKPVHRMLVDVEGEPASVVPADDAIAPSGDGIGALNTASVHDFDVLVMDGRLDIHIAAEVGPAVLSAIVVTREE